ncbi:MAG: OB-fold nucleic acid binding domain-containing protein, partial [archaeon]
MIRTHYSSEVKPADGNVTLAGWAQNIRVLGKIAFIKLRDREGVSQITIPSDNKNFGIVKNITPESVLAVTGKAKESKQSQNGWELIPEKIDILNIAEVPLPLDISGKIESE